MSRLGQEHGSYWAATAPGTNFRPYPGGDLKVDVAVLGGGITGLMTALLLEQEGLSVAVVEAGRVAGGVTGSTTAKITSLQGLVSAIDAGGGQVFEQTRALNLRPGFPCTVRTEHGDLRAEHVVLATHLPFFDPTAFFAKTSPSRSYAAAVTLAGPAPDGMYLSADSPTRSIRPLVAGGSQAVLAGEEHKVGHGGDTRRHHQAL